MNSFYRTCQKKKSSIRALENRVVIAVILSAAGLIRTGTCQSPEYSSEVEFNTGPETNMAELCLSVAL